MSLKSIFLSFVLVFSVIYQVVAKAETQVTVSCTVKTYVNGDLESTPIVETSELKVTDWMVGFDEKGSIDYSEPYRAGTVNFPEPTSTGVWVDMSVEDLSAKEKDVLLRVRFFGIEKIYQGNSSDVISLKNEVLDIDVKVQVSCDI